MFELLLGLLVLAAIGMAARLEWLARRRIDEIERVEMDADYDPLARERAIQDQLHRVRNGPSLHQGQDL